MTPFEAGNFDVGAPGPAEARTRPVAPSALAVAVVTGILVALVLLRPVHGVDAGLRAAIETAIAVAATLTARLLLEIFDRRRQLRDLLLVLGVLALALADFSYWAGPVVAGVHNPASGDAVRLIWELIGALGLGAAAFTPPTLTVRPLHGRARVAVGLGLGVVAAGTMLVEALVVHSATSPATTGAAAGTAHSVAVGVEVLSAAIVAVAGLAFVAGSWRGERGTEFLAGASLLLGAASVQFITVPAVPTAWVSPRDGGRLIAFALLLGGACLRYAHVQRRDAYAALCSERERVARDLHDGLAQDLACITTQAQRFDCHLGPEHPLMLATRDALAELRGLVADLTASTASTSDEAVRLVARELGHRLDLEVNVRSEGGARWAVDGRLELQSRDELIRATREAIVNAAVHGEARHVDVDVSRRAGTVVVRVSGARATPEPRPVGVAAPKRRARGVSRLSAEWSRTGRRRPA